MNMRAQACTPRADYFFFAFCSARFLRVSAVSSGPGSVRFHSSSGLWHMLRSPHLVPRQHGPGVHDMPAVAHGRRGQRANAEVLLTIRSATSANRMSGVYGEFRGSAQRETLQSC